MHVTSLFFTFASTLSGTLAVFKQSILVRWQELSHAYKLLLAHKFDVNCEVTDPDNVSLFEFIIDVCKRTLMQLFLGLFAWLIISDSFRQIFDELCRHSEPLHSFLVSFFPR
jgi:hypothetical protein